jgi:hypothetical protein
MHTQPFWQNQPDPAAVNREGAQNHVQRHNLAGFRAPKLDTVRQLTHSRTQSNAESAQ